MPGRRSWLYMLLREARYRLRPFWYTCWRNCGTISGNPCYDLEFDLEVQVQNQRSLLWNLFREAGYPLGPFWCTYWRNFGTISSTTSFALEFDLEDQMQSQRSWLCKLLGAATYRLTRAPLGYLAERAPLRGQILPPPPLNSRMRGRSEVGEAANENFWWVLFNQIQKILKDHMSGQGQVKGQNRHVSPYRLLRRCYNI